MDIKKGKIGNALESVAPNHVVAEASAIYDQDKEKYQGQINAEVDAQIFDPNDENPNTLIKRVQGVEGLGTISLGPVEAQIATGTDFDDPTAEQRAKVPTVGAMLDGLNDGIYDVSKRNPTGGENSDGKFTLAYILANADTLIPTSRRHGGMEICFVRSSDNKYVQYRLMSPTWSTSEADWQGVDDNVVGGSNNPIKSGGVADLIILQYTGTELHSKAWTFAPLKIIAGVTYKVRRLSGDVTNFNVNSQVGPYLNDNAWHDFTPEADGVPFMHVGGGIVNAPVIQITTEKNLNFAYENETKVKYIDVANNLTTTESGKVLDARQGKALNDALNAVSTTINATVESITGDLEFIKKFIVGYIKIDNISVTSGTHSLSKTNIYNGSTIPAGTKLKFIVTGDDYIDKFRVVGDTWTDVIGYTDFVDGQVFDVILAYDTASLGMYIESAHVIGTGTVNVDFIILNDNSINNKVNDLESKQLNIITGVAKHTSFLFTIPAKAGVTYLIKWVSGDAKNIAVLGSNNGVMLKLNQWVEFTPAVDATYFYTNVTSTSGLTAPTIWIGEKEGVLKAIEEFDNSISSNFNVQVTGVPSVNREAFLIPFPFVAGNTYLVKHVSGYRGTIATISGDGVALVTGKYVEFTPADATQTPFIYCTSTSGKTAPVLDIALKSGNAGDIINIKSNISVIKDDIDDINKKLDVTRITTYPGESGTSFMVAPYNFVVGTTYLVKHVSGYLSNIATTFADAVNLQTGEYVEFTPATSTQPYSYAGTTEGKTAPVLDIIIKDSVRGEIIDIGKDINRKADNITYHTINVSRDGTSRTGRAIHFSGLTAISDAINSITDASEGNRYIIHVEGVFYFNDPLTVPMEGGNEYSIIFMKDYVDIEGDGPNNSAIIMEFPANATFHDGKTYSDYQPIYFYTGGHKISGMKIMGKNCRYAFHIEAGNGSQDKTIDIDGCEVEYLGHPDYTGGYGDCFGTGMNSGQIWNIRNCTLRYYTGNAFGMHVPLSHNNSRRVGTVNFENCVFAGNVSLHNYQVDNNTIINFVDCAFANGRKGIIGYSVYNNRSWATKGDYTTVLTNGNTMEAVYACASTDVVKGTQYRGAVLRIKSSSTGSTSVVRFDHTSSAFLAMIGNGINEGCNTTIYGWDTSYGYVWRDGGTNISGQAFGTIDVDETASNNISLGKLLGDCSTTNKTLGITIDGTDYTVIFNENYTSKDNDYVLGVINDAIDGVGVADVFSPILLYYPNINGLTRMLCNDSNSILRGMGVVVTQTGIRRAKNSDGYIDGIALDDIANGQFGRMITRGFIFNQVYRTTQYNAEFHTTLDDTISQIFNNSTLGISASEDGVFKVGQTPSLLKQVRVNIQGADFAAYEIVK